MTTQATQAQQRATVYVRSSADEPWSPIGYAVIPDDVTTEGTIGGLTVRQYDDDGQRRSDPQTVADLFKLPAGSWEATFPFEGAPMSEKTLEVIFGKKWLRARRRRQRIGRALTALRRPFTRRTR